MQIKLLKPVTYGGQTYETITLREPVARDLVLMEKHANTEIERAVWLISTLANVPIDVVYDFSMPDLKQAQGAITPFFETFSATLST